MKKKKFSNEQMKSFVHGIASVFISNSELVIDIRATSTRNYFKLAMNARGRYFILNFEPGDSYSWKSSSISCSSLNNIVAKAFPHFLLKPCQMTINQLVSLGLSEDDIVEAIFNDIKKKVYYELNDIKKYGDSTIKMYIHDIPYKKFYNDDDAYDEVHQYDNNFIEFASFDELMVKVDMLAQPSHIV